MIINHLEKLFITNDAATMMKELEVWKIFVQILMSSVVC